MDVEEEALKVVKLKAKTDSQSGSETTDFLLHGSWSSMEVLSLQENNPDWRSWQPMNSGICAETIVTSRGPRPKIVQCYNSETGFWTRAADFNDPVAVGHISGTLYVFGRRWNGRIYVGVYDIQKNTGLWLRRMT